MAHWFVAPYLIHHHFPGIFNGCGSGFFTTQHLRNGGDALAAWKQTDICFDGVAFNFFVNKIMRIALARDLRLVRDADYLPWISFNGENGIASISICPDSILLKSKTSLTSDSRNFAESSILFENSCCSAVKLRSARCSLSPIIPAIGVRISCDI